MNTWTFRRACHESPLRFCIEIKCIQIANGDGISPVVQDESETDSHRTRGWQELWKFECERSVVSSFLAFLLRRRFHSRQPPYSRRCNRERTGRYTRYLEVGFDTSTLNGVQRNRISAVVVPRVDDNDQHLCPHQSS